MMPGYYQITNHVGTVTERLDRQGLWRGDPLALIRPPTADEITAMNLADVVAQSLILVHDARAQLTQALRLLDSMPLPDPADQAAASAQIDDAMVQYRALEGTAPADVVDLANRVSTHVQSNGYAAAKAAKARFAAQDARFLADPTVTLPQLVAHVRNLTEQLGLVRDA